MSDWVLKSNRTLSIAVRKIALEMFSRIIHRSPVLSGRFRGNWQVAIGSAPGGTLERYTKDEGDAIIQADADMAGLVAGDIVTMVNNLPYAQRLEDGYSGKAPAGMVGLTVQEFESVVRDVERELSKL